MASEAESTPPIAAFTAFGFLQLPIKPNELENTFSAFWTAYLGHFPEGEIDAAVEALALDVTNWLQELVAEERLLNAIEQGLTKGPQDPLERKSLAYCDFVRIIAQRYSLKPAETIRLCSSLYFVWALVSSFQMSDSAITGLMKDQLGVAKLNSVIMGDLTSYLNVRTDLESDAVAQLLQYDELAAKNEFSDATMLDLIETLNESSTHLGIEVPIGDRFGILTEHTPYIQILHYQTVITEFHDFKISNLYEFSPRGLTATQLFDYHRTIGLETGADNPFLNNAKSTHSADLDWAIQKKLTQRPSAIALSEILSELETLPYVARKSFCSQIRMAVLQAIEILSPSKTTVPDVRSHEQIESWFRKVAAANTQTRGVLEQRSVDYLVSAVYGDGDWICRGLGDAVNATNISRRKLGDAECLNGSQHKIHAFEPHGGNLTAKYVEEHLRTVEKVLNARMEALTQIAPAEAWDVSLFFVAHSIDPVDFATDILGFSIKIRAMTFDELLNTEHQPDLALFNRHVVGRLNTPGVREEIRKSANLILESA